MDAPFQATHQTKRMLYEMMLCAEYRGAYVGYVRGEFSRTLTGFFQEEENAILTAETDNRSGKYYGVIFWRRVSYWTF